MKKENTLPLNTSFVNQRIKELDLKQIWLASKIGVDKITINRWTSGKVKRIARHNAEVLAKCLQCSISDIILSSDIISAGTNVDKESAIESILTDDLISILSPLEKWDLAESIIKASIHPNISPEKIAQLYNHLWCVNLMKNNHEQAIYYAYKCLSISKKYDNKRMSGISLFNIATAHALKGSYHTAMTIYIHCISNIEHFQTPKERAAIYNNLAIIHQYYCRFSESINSYKQSIELLMKGDNFFKLCLTYLGLGDLYVEIGSTKEAVQALAEAYKYSVKSNYNTGIIRSTLYQIDAFIVSKQPDQAKKLLKYNIQTLIESNVNDMHCFEILARYHRHTGDYEQALEIIDAGLSNCSSHPLEESRMLHERARLAFAMKDFQGEIDYRKKANRLLKSCKLHDRVWNIVIREYGHMFDAKDCLSHT